MNENEFKMNGKRYITVNVVGCKDCAFWGDGSSCTRAPSCLQDRREDGRNVIFVEVSKPEEKGYGK